MPPRPKAPPKKKAPPKRPPRKRGRRMDEEGGETVTVEVYVNGKRKFGRCATITGEKGPQNRRYKLDDGSEKTIRGNDFMAVARELLK